MIELLGAKLHRTTAYHPQANGLVERFHRHLKAALKARLKDANWLDVLPWVLLGIRTAPKEDLRTSSAKLVYGAPLTVPGDFVTAPHAPVSTAQHLQQLRDKVQSLAPVPTSAHGTPPAALPTSLNNAQFVFVRRDSHRPPLQRPYEGPFAVLEAGVKTFKLAVGNRTEVVSIDHLKPAHLDVDTPVQVAQPKPRGRPTRRMETAPKSPLETRKAEHETTASTQKPREAPEHRSSKGRVIRRPPSHFPGTESGGSCVAECKRLGARGCPPRHMTD